jgi:hypothetical protein
MGVGETTCLRAPYAPPPLPRLYEELEELRKTQLSAPMTCTLTPRPLPLP